MSELTRFEQDLFDSGFRQGRRDVQPLIDSLLEALRAVVREFGWRGSGPLDREEYYCEHCNQHAGDYDETAHLNTCPIRIAKLVIAKAEGK